MQGHQNIWMTSPKRLVLSDTVQLNKSSNFKLVNKLKNNEVNLKSHNKTKALLNKSTRTHNQEDELKNPKHQYSLNNKTTKEETINQHKEDNTLGLDENTLNQYNERIICNGSDNEFESNNNNESSTRRRAPIENIFQPYKNQEKQKKDRPMLFKTKYANEEKTNDKVEKVEASTQIKIDINETHNNLFLTRDHANNNYKHYTINKTKHKETYIESSTRNNENNTDAKANVVNNVLAYQTNTKQIRLDNAKLDQYFVEANKESTNNIDSHTIKSKEYKDNIIFEKEKSNKKYLTKDETNHKVEK